MSEMLSVSLMKALTPHKTLLDSSCHPSFQKIIEKSYLEVINELTSTLYSFHNRPNSPSLLYETVKRTVSKTKYRKKRHSDLEQHFTLWTWHSVTDWEAFIEASLWLSSKYWLIVLGPSGLRDWIPQPIIRTCEKTGLWRENRERRHGIHLACNTVHNIDLSEVRSD